MLSDLILALPPRPAATSAGSLMRITRCGMGICDCWWCSRVLHSPAPSPHAPAARPRGGLATPDCGGVMCRRIGRIGVSVAPPKYREFGSFLAAMLGIARDESGPAEQARAILAALGGSAGRHQRKGRWSKPRASPIDLDEIRRTLFLELNRSAVAGLN